jgi:glycosyltransferase involved in cell wall biosynthesis
MTYMQKVADAILGYDDGSTDESKNIFLALGGNLLPLIANRTSGQGATLELREYLLSEGRKLGYKYFIVLDCDEIVIESQPSLVRREILSLSPGEKLVMNWVMLHPDGKSYLSKPSVWKPNDKDFAFRDASNLIYPKGSKFVHFSRTPSAESGELKLRRIPFCDAFTLHFQFFNWELGQIKQCWYRLNEVVTFKHSYKKVNLSYLFTKEFPNAELSTSFDDSLKIDFSSHPASKTQIESSWYFQDILGQLNYLPRTKVNNIDIWFLPQMKTVFCERYGKEHKFMRTVECIEKNKLRIRHVIFILQSFQKRNK